MIKARLAQGMKNKDMQFCLNCPNQPVNSGRISGHDCAVAYRAEQGTAADCLQPRSYVAAASSSG